jgi:hypothetical protein
VKLTVPFCFYHMSAAAPWGVGHNYKPLFGILPAEVPSLRRHAAHKVRASKLSKLEQRGRQPCMHTCHPDALLDRAACRRLLCCCCAVSCLWQACSSHHVTSSLCSLWLYALLTRCCQTLTTAAATHNTSAGSAVGDVSVPGWVHCQPAAGHVCEC